VHKRQKITTCGGKYYYDKAAANRVINFFAKYLIHVKGKWAGEPFKLSKWQATEIIKPLFGWKRKKDGLRRFQTIWVDIPKKNGKSTLASGLSLYLLFADNEVGAEVYAAATDRFQSSIVYNSAKTMLEASPKLLKYAFPGKKIISIRKTNSFFTAMSSDVPNKHGINPSAVIIDEVHAHRTPELIDTLVSGSGASREQPIYFYITTAGWDRTSICWEYHKIAEKVLKNEKYDETQLVCMYGARQNENWRSKKVWKENNPNLNISVKEDYIKSEFKKALRTPRKRNMFKQLHLNMWTQQAVVWLNLKKWDENKRKIIIDELRKYPCFGGLDLSSTTDLSAFVMAFKTDEGYILVPKFYIPADNIKEREEKDAVQYSEWVKEGLITTTEGDVIDYNVIEPDIIDAWNNFDIKEIGYDPYNATHIIQNLEKKDIAMIPVRQGMLTMSPASKEFERLINSGKMIHDGNPVLRWMAANASVQTDNVGNIKPIKKKSTARIDGIVAAIIAIERGLRFLDKSATIYSERGIRTIDVP